MEQQTITLIKKGKLQRYQIFVDGKFLISVHQDVLVKFAVYKGMVVDATQFKEWMQADEQAKIRQAILRYLSYRPRTVWEVKQYLQQKDWDDELGKQVINELSEKGYLDDLHFAKMWVVERKNSKKYGPKRLRQELLQKKIDTAWIDRALSDWDATEEYQTAQKLAEKRYLRISHQPWEKIERKLGHYLLRQGYQTDTVYTVLRELYGCWKEKE